MVDTRLSARQARLLHLAAQGLLHAPPARPTRRHLLQTVARMQMLQIDTIHVVARSPYLVLFSRLGAYPMHWLDEALADGRLAECWAHEACFVTAEDHALHRSARPLREQHWAMRRARRVMAADETGMRRLLDEVRRRGPVRSADFGRRKASAAGWWDWKPEKNWLEAWFALGELMVARRDGFQRVYDLSERVLARHPPDAEPVSSAAARRQMLARAVRALGVARTAWVADYFRLARVTRAELDALCADGVLMPVGVAGLSGAAYVHADHADLLDRVCAGKLRASHTTVLSPFDPVVWDRRRARELFDFDYTLECYMPAPRRRYGYFVLPLLHHGRLVGRLDAKAHRRDGVFEVRAIHLEPTVQPDDILTRALAHAIAACAAWHDTTEVRVRRASPRALLKPLCAALARLRPNHTDKRGSTLT